MAHGSDGRAGGVEPTALRSDENARLNQYAHELVALRAGLDAIGADDLERADAYFAAK